MIRRAILSDCRRYRYLLDRVWGDEDGPGIAWIMLNPSTADARIDDPTIRRVVGFSRGLGASWARVVNLYALRATKPKSLETAEDPVGPDNGRYLRHAARSAERLVAAWGGSGPFPGRRDLMVASMLRDVGGPLETLWSLGQTKSGQPRHPLYLPKTAELEVFASLRQPKRTE